MTWAVLEVFLGGNGSLLQKEKQLINSSQKWLGFSVLEMECWVGTPHPQPEATLEEEVAGPGYLLQCQPPPS